MKTALDNISEKYSVIYNILSLPDGVFVVQTSLWQPGNLHAAPSRASGQVCTVFSERPPSLSGEEHWVRMEGLTFSDPNVVCKAFQERKPHTWKRSDLEGC